MCRVLKIIISPSKTQNHDKYEPFEFEISEPKYIDKTKILYQQIAKLSKVEMADIFKIKGKILESVYDNYSSYDLLTTKPALLAYTGFVFKELEIGSYRESEWQYATEHLRILSALYGVLRPLDAIKAYRLDYKVKLGMNLYDFWKDSLVEEFEQEDIVNLASDEFSKSVNKDMTTIKFLDEKNGKLKTIGTYAKKARGAFLNEMIKNQIEDIEELKKISVMGYRYDNELSEEKVFVFTR